MVFSSLLQQNRQETQVHPRFLLEEGTESANVRMEVFKTNTQVLLIFGNPNLDKPIPQIILKVAFLEIA